MIASIVFLAAGLAFATGDESADVSSAAPVAVSTAAAALPETPPSAHAPPGPDAFAPSFLAPSSTIPASSAAVSSSSVDDVRAAAPAPGAAPVPAPAVPKADLGKDRAASKKKEEEEAATEPLALPPDFKPVRGVHLSAWIAGAPKSRRKFLDQIPGTFINAVTVPLKETDGHVYIPGVARARDLGTALTAIPDPGALVADIHARGLLAIARIVVFKDNTLARKHPELAVKRPDGSLWRNKNGIAWVDPYRREIWEYNLDLAIAAARLGFDEIQFDYVRFPSDGDTRQCRYSKAGHSEKTASENIREFLRYAKARLAPLRIPMSVAVFGMTTTARDDMGIGQDLRTMSELSDAVSPMMYPSHYAHGEYGLKNPNREPYKVIFRGLRDAKRRLGRESWKLRPYLQDFSLGYRYGLAEVQAQLIAAQRQGIESFILWNAANHYTWKALELRNGSPIQYPRPKESSLGQAPKVPLGP